MFIPQGLRRNILPWLCAVAFVANFLCAAGGLDVAQPLLGSASQESARQLADGASQDVHEASGRFAWRLAQAGHRQVPKGAGRTSGGDCSRIVFNVGGVVGPRHWVIYRLIRAGLEWIIPDAPGSGSPTQRPYKPQHQSKYRALRQAKHTGNTDTCASRYWFDGAHDKPRCARRGTYRMGKLNRWWLPLISSVTLLVGISACGNNPATEADIDFPRALEQASGEGGALVPALAGTITIDGSSTVFPVTTVMAKTFQKIHPDVHFMIGVSGTGGGFKKFCVGETDITGASRPINATEVELCKTHNIDYFELPIAFDSLSVVVHPQNTMVNCLTIAELKRMWEPGAQGKVTHWNQIRSLLCQSTHAAVWPWT